MTIPARIKQADLKRLAAVAKSESVKIKVELDGMVLEITPCTDVKEIVRPAGWEIDL
ncbi:hypothetical protein IHQ71_30935 (plasmid) [Rhizobium sp. TH2]|uniref:hypothetical protein n=1 Tax=Rhizobium sp. TH2 TaxID=2775403 RepID=UPI002157C413|nr:hypothetical protein [Rhizobium sp. TH2]UVC12419.1 hypothetical protein IHQ71_30935 [Rhizobium sp. TH2]